MIKLYDLELSGNCYKIRLFLSILDISYQKIAVNVHAKENRTQTFLSMNPNGLIPVLTDNQTTVFDSAAILTYLAKIYANNDWFPTAPIELSNVVKWLAFEQSECRYGLARARAIVLNNPTPLAKLGTLEESQTLGKLALQILDKQLKKTKWLVEGEKPTVCDIACYPYVAMCSEGGIALESYNGIKQWLAAIERLNGYIPLPNYNKSN